MTGAVMRWIIAAVIIIGIGAGSHANADLVCPKGSLSGMWPNSVWQQYATNSRDYISRMLRRMEDARDRRMVMERMFEEGFIAATDIISAYCVPGPDREPWNDAIKRQREQEWCRQWGDAHFCSR